MAGGCVLVSIELSSHPQETLPPWDHLKADLAGNEFHIRAIFGP